MKENSLFAILLRSPWWISFLLAAVIALVALATLPKPFANYAAFAGGPFIIVGFIAAARQLRQPSAARVASTLDTLNGMSWPAFAEVVEQAFRRDGYTVTPFKGSGADFEIVKPGRRALVACKRWKAARQGMGPLRELLAAAEAADIPLRVYLTAGEVTENALRFAAENRIELVHGAGLAKLLRNAQPARPR